MLLYRVFAYLPAAATAATAGHPQYIHTPQGRGRLDNPSDYTVWYLSDQPSGAIGETFADLVLWRDAMFPAPYLPGAQRVLGTYDVADDLPILDLDDANALLQRGLRPSQVIQRNRPVTQAWAKGIFDEKDHDGTRKWDGVRWWSYQRPQWRIVGLWGNIPPACVSVDPLTVAHPAVRDAARTLGKRIL
jgi:hypothetical protein